MFISLNESSGQVKRPIVMVADITGQVAPLLKLAENIEKKDPSRYIVGLAPNFKENASKAPTLHDMAEELVAELLENNDAPVYHLFGYSFGGQLAFEIAKILTLKGKKVGFLGVLDTDLDKCLAVQESSEDTKNLLLEMVEKFPGWMNIKIDKSTINTIKQLEAFSSGNKSNFFKEDLRDITEKQIKALFTALRKLSDDPSTIAILNITEQNLLTSLTQLTDKVRQVTVFKALEEESKNSDLGWSSHSEEEPCVIGLKANHFTALKNSEAIAAVVERSMYEIESFEADLVMEKILDVWGLLRFLVENGPLGKSSEGILQEIGFCEQHLQVLRKEINKNNGNNEIFGPQPEPQSKQFPK